jgi:hypothetical protein
MTSVEETMTESISAQFHLPHCSFSSTALVHALTNSSNGIAAAAQLANRRHHRIVKPHSIKLRMREAPGVQGMVRGLSLV